MSKHIGFITVVFLFVIGCKEAKNTKEPPFPFTFNAMDADSISFMFQGPLNESIGPDKLTLHLIPGLKLKLEFGQLYPSGMYYTERDIDVEQAMSEAFKTEYPDYKDGYVLYNGSKRYISSSLGESVSYCTRSVRSISISAPTKLFGLEAGNILNDYFSVEMGTYQNFAAFDYIVSADGIPVSTFSRISTIEEYVSYQPLLRPLSFKLSKIPDELPTETKFYIKLEMADGKIIRDSTFTIHIAR